MSGEKIFKHLFCQIIKARESHIQVLTPVHFYLEKQNVMERLNKVANETFLISSHALTDITSIICITRNVSSNREIKS